MPTAPLSHALRTTATGGTATPVAQILSLGAYIPDGVLTNADMEAMVETSDSWIVERTGIRERRRVAPGQTVAAMGARAAAEALARAGNPVVDAIIVATCSAETRLPSVACRIQQRLGLTGMPAFDINAACSGFVYALALADSMIRSHTLGTVLVVASEALTPMVDYTDRSTCVLFGDGAAATIVGSGAGDGGIRAVRWAADGGEADLIYFGAREDDPQGPSAIRMSGRGTFRFAVERLSGAATQLCDDAGWSPDDVDWFIPHQANLRIIEATAKRLGVSMARVILNVERVGNTSAASIPLAIHEAAAAGRLQPGQKIISVAFGSGVTWGGVALEWTGNPSL
ncbi:MAG: ketoacyl-ACP synthase III [Candidatus Dormibacteraeota bacterium]|uniref:Beta-ketoacyl-[acyl-carrier-protein] synthase III n=1 Tax=Candidatus Aeolococcus gillhamiae TaxID=3127015 RepID=A0A2W6AJF6_9BACT|nr:ketoacyl-ACP synthase III [Candidatus Dormibacteraeota bacterium]PZR77851.1 MAG: 3-oxoacyl-ACP synthase [Candidatus Dormibacter sp. RRmetagenome_bin12]